LNGQSEQSPVKRIAIDGHILTGMYQGSRTYLENILRCLGELDPINCYQIFSYDPQATRALLDFPNFEHHRIAISAPIPRLLFYWVRAKRIHDFDLLLTQYILAPFLTVPQFVVMHDILPETHPRLFPPIFRWRSRLLFRFSAFRAKQIFAVSQYTRSQIIARYRVKPEKVHLTYNGFDPGSRPDDGTAADPSHRDGDYVLYVGRLEQRKNIDIIIKALSLMKTQGLRLTVVAQRKFASPALLKLVTESPNVEHRENVDNQELDRLYRGARVFVYPSSAEGFGLPILEALARGVPVITSDKTSLPEVGGAFARYFDPTTEDASVRLAALLDETCLQPRKPDAQALSAHLAKFDWRQSAKTILNQIERLHIS